MMSNTPWITAEWNAPANVHGLTTTRDGAGFSEAPFDTFNMGNTASPRGDDPAVVKRNRAELVKLAALPSEPFWLKQVHGVDVVDLRRASQLDDLPTADASFTRERGLVLAIQTADCLPVLFASRDGSVIGAAHAGWRSLLEGVIEKTIAAMGSDPADMSVWLGPAAGPSKYEIGLDVYDAFVSRNWSAGAAFKTTRDYHWNVDLYALARIRLEEAGITASNVFGGDLCTISDSKRFFSHRRDQRTGRMVSLLWMSEN